MLTLDHVATSATPTQKGGNLAVQATVRNHRHRDAHATLAVSISDAEGNRLAHGIRDRTFIAAGATSEIVLEDAVPGVKPWSPETPHLYTLKVTLQEADNPLATHRIRVGFRTLEVVEGALLLNGEPIVLTGFNRHEDSPDRAMSPAPDVVRRDLNKMKDAGANFVRLCHYPHDPSELDLCDEIGLLAMAEIPLYWWSGREDNRDPDERTAIRTLRAAKRQLRAMIHRDINHPSIVLWSVSNETDESRPEVAAGNADLIRLAKRLDPTRLAVHVSDRWRDHPHFTADDVLCINGYPGYEAMRQHGEIDFPALTAYWRTALAKLHTRYPDRPILITEFGYPAIYGSPDGALGTDTQAEVIEHEYKGMDAPYICGATLWCWADHPWPEHTFAFCSYLNQSPFGVLTRKRHEEKRAYRTIRTLFRARQGYPEPETHEEPQASSAGYEVKMVRDHLDDIPQAAFPEGFEIRPMRLDEGGLWTDIWRDAEPYADIEAELFHNQFGSDLQATQWRSFIVTNPSGLAVATITAWYHRTFKGKDYGQIHWVAVRKAYWGRGLGKAMLTHALNHMATWHDRAFLGTQTQRIPAIKIYLDFGFVPDLDQPGAERIWQEVKDQLDHPALEAIDLEGPTKHQHNQGDSDD
jgi:beta-glucuronidase